MLGLFVASVQRHGRGPHCHANGSPPYRGTDYGDVRRGSAEAHEAIAGRLRRLRDVREHLLATGTFTAAGGGEHALFPLAIGPEEGRALAGWTRRTGARRTLEVGLGYAVATLFVCEALLENGGGRHVAVDPYQLAEPARPRATRFAGAGIEILDAAGVRDLVELHAEESQTALPRLLAAGERFDLAFVDGNHRFEAVFLDLYYCGRLLPEGGAVFLDDTQLPGVRRALDFFARNLGWRVEDGGEEGAEHAWTVARTGPASELRRPFARFVEF